MTDPDRPEQGEQEGKAAQGTGHDLHALYRHALETGEAGPLVRALCETYRINLRGLAEVSGVTQPAISRWLKGGHAHRRTIEALRLLVKPDRSTRRRLENAGEKHPFGGRTPYRLR